MAAHTVLETTRDALFLASLPPERLPWVYLAIAVLAGAATLHQAGREKSQGLALWMVSAAGGTLGFWLLDSAAAWMLYALYIWTGVIATVVLMRFWLLLSRKFTVTQAKRIYGLIGAGSVTGAIFGSSLAILLTELVQPRHLLAAAAALLALSALGPPVLDRAVPDTNSKEPRGREPQERDPLARESRTREPIARNLRRTRVKASPVWRSQYARRVGGLTLLATVTLTLVDYVFKHTVAQSVSAPELAEFFARAYFGLNMLSLVVQVAFVQRLVRALSVNGALAILPLCLLSGAIGLAVGGGLFAALLLKAADGSLKHSLHRTATELLFVPMAERLRVSAKVLIELVGHRGGQAVAAVCILIALSFGLGGRVWGVVLCVLSVGWVTAAFALRRSYLSLFRETLQASARAPQLEFPELDLASLESLIAALNSTNDDEVKAALDLLAEENRTHLIPALILYHPSADVVVHALGLLARSPRDDYLPICKRLLESGKPEVKTAILRTLAAVKPDESLLRRFTQDACREVRITALASLVAAGWARASDTEILDGIVERGTEEQRLALVQAIHHHPKRVFEDWLVRLAQDENSPELQRAALSAMSAAPSARYLEVLIAMLEKRKLRSEARATLITLGDTALSFLSNALSDENHRVALRSHFPNTIARFEPKLAAKILSARLPKETNGAVRFKILRALDRLHAHNEGLKIDQTVVTLMLRRTLTHAFELLESRLILARGPAELPARATRVHELLIELLKDKERHAIERVFLLLGLRFESEEVAAILRGLRGPSPTIRAGSRELLEHMLRDAERSAILALVDDVPDEDRLSAAGAFYRPSQRSYEEHLRQLLDSSSEAVRTLTIYHIGELKLLDLRGKLEQLRASSNSSLSLILRHTLSVLAAADSRLTYGR